MIVDDSEITRRQIRTAVEDFAKEAYIGLNIEPSVIEAANGKEALQMLKDNKVNIILLDWTMPELSGLDFLKAVRSIETYKSLPIIMITGKKDKCDVIEALKYGATDYMVKPLDRQLFIEKMFLTLNIFRPTARQKAKLKP
jgi:two-component system chemotaxis response regulator CheY